MCEPLPGYDLWKLDNGLHEGDCNSCEEADLCQRFGPGDCDEADPSIGLGDLAAAAHKPDEDEEEPWAYEDDDWFYYDEETERERLAEDAAGEEEADGDETT